MEAQLTMIDPFERAAKYGAERATERAAKICEEMAESLAKDRMAKPYSAIDGAQINILRQAAARIRGEG